MLLVYTHKITNRLKYILDFVLKQNYGIDYEITNNRTDFLSYNGARLNYSFEPIPDSVQIQPTLLLIQDDIHQRHIDVNQYKGTPIFFCTEKGDLPFDIFAASFYLLTRYEEYLNTKLDRFGRFNQVHSLAYQKGFLNEPVVNIWLSWLRDILRQKYNFLEIKEPVYSFQTTIDIDNAFAYRHKGFFRQSLALLKALVKDRQDFFRRIQVFRGLQNDPYNTYEYMNEIHTRYNLSPVYFFLLADYGGKDNGLPVKNPNFQKLIYQHSQRFDVGIHPSLMSFIDNSIFENEVSLMSKIIEKEVTNSRFHFIKFKFPNSYEKLIGLNILNDYSMGYPSTIGFRNSYAGDYPFFNLVTNKATSLIIHPFQVMDASMKFYLKLSPEEAVIQANKIKDKIKAVKGKFTILWHNESLCDIGIWKGWRGVYEQIIC